MGDRSGSTKPSVARFQASPRRGGPYDGAGGRAGGAPSYRRGWEEDGGRRKEPLATCPRRGGPGLEKSSRAAAGADAADCGFGSRAGPRIQRADRGAAAVGGPHPDRCIPCLWYFQHVTGCGKGRSCTSCHHEDHRDPQSDLHPSKRLHALGRCVPCRNHFKGICPRRAEACGFCHQEEHRKALGAKESGDETVEVVPLAPGAPARRDEERKNSGERSPEGSAPQKTDLGASGPGGDEELVIASSVSGSEKTVAHGEKAEAGQEKRDQETGKSDRKGEDHRAAKAGDKNAVHYVRQRGQNEPRAHERGVCRPCSFYFIGPQGCLKRERCPDCHHADHANPHSAAHPSKLLHLKGQCRPCIPFKRGTCAKSPENCVYCHHSSHLVEGQDTASQQKQADVAESEGQPDTAEFPVQDLDDGESAAGGRDAAHDSQADLSGGLADEETLGESGRVQEGGVAASVGDSEGEEDSSTPQASKRHSVDGGIATFLGEAVGAQERKQEGQMANKEQLLESAAEPPNALDRTSPGDADALDTARAETSEAEQCL
ncbi:hypothetical protein BESB_055140 [Besnoitia besnoiti]|uniref:Uncharacterized protein n=1 Tax=Besnoitia besnoiti TaxID=94643 RepID=A0A2A9MJN5_BESBE|nr:hypothetical protein BESB_055140 [Besnoitia besnoiti]PFH35863.1 hypothetical protein BESB_055140 [Besnoitia besnoiti]